jgi:predicted double-glycine peptidase
MRSIINYFLEKDIPEKTIIKIGQEAEKNMKSQEHEGKKTADEGLDFLGMKGIARKYNLTGLTKANANIKFLKFFLNKQIPIFVCWVPGEELEIDKNGKIIVNGHYSLVIGLKNEKIILADPEPGKKSIHNMPFKKFEERWYKGYYNPPGVCKERIKNWVIVFWNKEEKLRLPKWIKGRRF